MPNTESRTSISASEGGFGLVELMVSVVVGLMALLAIMSVFVTSEAQKRTTTVGADAQGNALVSLATIERDLRVSGLGLIGLSCANVDAYNKLLTPSIFSFTRMPVSIARDAPTPGSDKLVVVYSDSAYGNVPTRLKDTMSSSGAVLNAANGDGLFRGDIIMVSEPSKGCSLIQASTDATYTGTTWTVPHDPAPAYPHNPPTTVNIFPAGGYSTDATVTNMGALVRREYFVQDASLMVRNLNLPDSTVAPLNPTPIVDSIIAIRAQYGRDTNGDGYIDVYDNTAPTDAAQIVAVRIAVVARSGQLERTEVSPATLSLWSGGSVADGGAIALDNMARQYRYKVYQTKVPLRNVIWNNN